MDDEAAQGVFIARVLKSFAKSVDCYGHLTSLILRGPVFGVQAGPFTNAIIETPQKFMNQIHGTLVLFEKIGSSHVESAGHLESIHDSKVALQEAPNQRPAKLQANAE